MDFTSIQDCYTLSNGAQIPCVGLGTWKLPNNAESAQVVRNAIDAGYRHIDTAAGYGNESAVGEGIKKSGIKRSDIFVTTKLNNPDHGYDATVAAFAASLENLGLDYVDLYLIHWPNPKLFRDCWKKKNAETWKAFEEFQKQGKIRALGISNFLPRHIDALLENAEILPTVNQILLCPGVTQEETTAHSRKYKMLPVAYSPLGTGTALDNSELVEIAVTHRKTLAQVCMRWSLQMGFLPIPKTTRLERMKENADIFDFSLSAEEMSRLSRLKGFSNGAKDPDTIDF